MQSSHRSVLREVKIDGLFFLLFYGTQTPELLELVLLREKSLNPFDTLLPRSGTPFHVFCDPFFFDPERGGNNSMLLQSLP